MSFAKNYGRFRLTIEVKGHAYRELNRQKYEFPMFAGKIAHVHTVCTKPFLLPLKGLGTRLGIILIVHVSVCIQNLGYYHSVNSDLLVHT